MREDYGNLPMSIHDDGFGDIGFDADGPDFIRDDVDTNIDVNFLVLLTLLNFILTADCYLINVGKLDIRRNGSRHN